MHVFGCIPGKDSFQRCWDMRYDVFSFSVRVCEREIPPAGRIGKHGKTWKYHYSESLYYWLIYIFFIFSYYCASIYYNNLIFVIVRMLRWRSHCVCCFCVWNVDYTLCNRPCMQAVTATGGRWIVVPPSNRTQYYYIIVHITHILCELFEVKHLPGGYKKPSTAINVVLTIHLCITEGTYLSQLCFKEIQLFQITIQ